MKRRPAAATTDLVGQTRPRTGGPVEDPWYRRRVREDGRTPLPLLTPNLDRILDRDPLPYPDRIADLEPPAFADDGFAVVVHVHQVTWPVTHERLRRDAPSVHGE